MSPKPDIDTHLLSWMAGFTDGEGCIRIAQRGAKYRLKHGRDQYFLNIHLANTNREVLAIFKAIFGGSLYAVKRYKEHHKIGYQWAVSHVKAEAYLRLIFPYLKLKKPQAELAMEFLKTVNRGSGVGSRNFSRKYYTEDENASRNSMFRKMHSLNENGRGKELIQ